MRIPLVSEKVGKHQHPLICQFSEDHRMLCSLVMVFCDTAYSYFWYSNSDCKKFSCT